MSFHQIRYSSFKIYTVSQRVLLNVRHALMGHVHTKLLSKRDESKKEGKKRTRQTETEGIFRRFFFIKKNYQKKSIYTINKKCKHQLSSSFNKKHLTMGYNSYTEPSTHIGINIQERF